MFGNTDINSYSDYSNFISVYVPYTITSKKFKIYIVKGGKKIEVPGGEFVMDKPTVASFTPSSVNFGSTVTITITGSKFNEYNSYNKVFFGSTAVAIPYSSSSSALYTSIPSGLSAGNYSLSVSNGIDTVAVPGTLSVIIPSLASISPSSGSGGSSVVITGEGFGTSANYVSVKFGSYNATISTINNTQINAIVPGGIANGTWVVSVTVGGNLISNTLLFSVP
jgi:hypothetical protein